MALEIPLWKQAFATQVMAGLHPVYVVEDEVNEYVYQCYPDKPGRALADSAWMVMRANSAGGVAFATVDGEETDEFVFPVNDVTNLNYPAWSNNA